MSTYWFKRRRYGYGWFPVTWQAWTLVGIFLLLAIGGDLLISFIPSLSTLQNVLIYLCLLLLGLVILFWLTLKHSPRPKWRWGLSEIDNPEEDF